MEFKSRSADPRESAAIRELIERWVTAVHTGEIGDVLRDHSDEIVMFDVPPPETGVRGIEAYRETWPPFFEWQAGGATFELVELDITAGADVAFAHALLRCGSPEELERDPARRLRLTLGLRKEDGNWVVTHEHHSFTQGSDPAAEEQLRELHRRLSERTAAKDLDGLMEPIAKDVISYEHDAPLEHIGVAAVREVCRQGLDASEGAVGWSVPDLRVIARGDLAVAWGLNKMTAEVGGQKLESWSRGTRVFRLVGGQWELIHQHVSYPYDPATGEAKTGLVPG